MEPEEDPISLAVLPYFSEVVAQNFCHHHHTSRLSYIKSGQVILEQLRAINGVPLILVHI